MGTSKAKSKGGGGTGGGQQAGGGGGGDDKTQDAKKSYQTILAQEIEEGTHELERSTRELLVSGLSAGLDIGFSVLLMSVMLTLFQGQLPDPVVEVLLAGSYSVGFILVIFGRSELFTEHTTLAVLPYLAGRASLRQLGRLWGLVYVSNIAGTIAFGALLAFIGPALGIIERAALGEIAARALDHAWWVILVSAVLAGWMMGMVSWLVTAGRETISQVLFVALVTATIGIAHLHHCVVGSVEAFAALFAGAGATLPGIGRFLLFATLGNAIGGSVFVALLRFAQAAGGGGPGYTHRLDRGGRVRH